MLLGTGSQGPIAGRRVAITGMGVVSCCGVGSESLWSGLLGDPPVGERRVRDFDPERWFTAKEARQVDRFAQFSVAVASMALEDAGEVNADPGRSGVVIGTGVGGLESLEDQIKVFGEKGPRRVSPRLVPMMMANAGAGGGVHPPRAGTARPRPSPPPVPPGPTASGTRPGWSPRVVATSPSGVRPRPG